MWHLSVPWWELVLRSVVVYLFLYVLLRMAGRRQVGQLSPFDLILLLVLSNAVQNSMNAGDDSLLGGLISATTLVALNYLFDITTSRSKKLASAIEGNPTVLVHNGCVYPEALAAADLTRRELNAAMRKAGCGKISDVRMAMLETNGAISVVLRKNANG